MLVAPPLAEVGRGLTSVLHDRNADTSGREASSVSGVFRLAGLRASTDTAPGTPANPLRDLFLQNQPEDLLRRAIDPNSPDFEKLRAEIRKADTKAIIKSVEALYEVNTLRDIMMTEADVCA
ncbi:MAG: hypothetical protein HC915_08790, partial [Anaerolineae bacterium]|nr:hypothetical protein [Anaerolineae bacterium]